MCEPSMAPATCGKFQRASNSFTTMRKVSQVGLPIRRGCRVVTIAKHTSRMIFDIEESDTPNKWPAVRYPHCAANTQITQAILRSTSMAFRMCVSRRSTSCLNCLTNICIDSLLIRKLSSHCFRVKPGTICSHQLPWLRGNIQIVRSL